MKKQNSLYKQIMTGVSYFLPVVVAGGIILGLAFGVDAKNASLASFGATTPVAAWLLSLGSLAFSMMLPVLAGYIGYAIADRPALVPGFVIGLLARDGGSGFIGAIIGGILMGYVILLFKKATAKFPRALEATKTLILFPVVGTLVAGLIMLLINMVCAPLNVGLTNWLTNIGTGSLVVLCAILCVMIVLDIGGPINKTAYFFAVATLTAADGSIVPSAVMGSLAAGGLTIGIGCFLATVLFRKKFSPELREAGIAAGIMGLTFICEGAIPFAISKPKQVYPAMIIGSVVAGVLAVVFGVTLQAPIGGIFTFFLANKIGLYILSIVIGSLVNACIMGLLIRKDYVPEEEAE